MYIFQEVKIFLRVGKWLLVKDYVHQATSQEAIRFKPNTDSTTDLNSCC